MSENGVRFDFVKSIGDLKAFKYGVVFAEKVCVTCMFWSGYRKKEENKVMSISQKTQGVCLRHSNSSTEANFTCNHWVGKY